MAVRLPADWMQAADDRILEWLNEGNVASQSTFVDESPYDYHRNTIGRRLRLMSKINLVKEVGPGVYQITEKGIGYLNGDEDLRDVSKPE
jgi:repressor of nif and glnA expression